MPSVRIPAAAFMKPTCRVDHCVDPRHLVSRHVTIRWSGDAGTVYVDGKRWE